MHGFDAVGLQNVNGVHATHAALQWVVVGIHGGDRERTLSAGAKLHALAIVVVTMIMADQHLIRFQIDRRKGRSAAVRLKGIDYDGIAIFHNFKTRMSMPDNFHVSVLLTVDFATFYNIDTVLSIKRITLVELSGLC